MVGCVIVHWLLWRIPPPPPPHSHRIRGYLCSFPITGYWLPLAVTNNTPFSRLSREIFPRLQPQNTPFPEKMHSSGGVYLDNEPVSWAVSVSFDETLFVISQHFSYFWHKQLFFFFFLIKGVQNLLCIQIWLILMRWISVSVAIKK